MCSNNSDNVMNKGIMDEEQVLLDKLNALISGIPPPPSLAICKLSFDDMLLKINQNNEFFLHSTGKTVLENANPKVYFLNSGEISEEVAVLTQKTQARYVQNETFSSWTLLCENARAALMMGRPLKRSSGVSPGRRLSHLARRRQMFSRANLQQLSQNETKGPRIELKAAKSNVLKERVQARNYIESQKAVLPKRALFQSPEEEPPRPGHRTVPRNAPCRRLFTSSDKDVLPPAGTGGYDVSSWLASQNFAEARKRTRDDSRESDRKRRCPRRSLDFSDISPSQCSQASNQSSSSVSSTQTPPLSSSHKQRLLWAVSVALKEKGITSKNQYFKPYATEVFNICKKNLPLIIGTTATGGLSDKMLKFARKEAASVVRHLIDKSNILQDVSESVLNQPKEERRKPDDQYGKENVTRTPDKPFKFGARLWNSCKKSFRHGDRQLVRSRSCDLSFDDDYDFVVKPNLNNLFIATKRKRVHLDDSSQNVYNICLNNSSILVDATPLKAEKEGSKQVGLNNTVAETPEKEDNDHEAVIIPGSVEEEEEEEILMFPALQRQISKQPSTDGSVHSVQEAKDEDNSTDNNDLFDMLGGLNDPLLETPIGNNVSFDIIATIPPLNDHFVCNQYQNATISGLEQSCEKIDCASVDEEATAHHVDVGSNSVNFLQVYENKEEEVGAKYLQKSGDIIAFDCPASGTQNSIPPIPRTVDNDGTNLEEEYPMPSLQPAIQDDLPDYIFRTMPCLPRMVGKEGKDVAECDNIQYSMPTLPKMVEEGDTKEIKGWDNVLYPMPHATFEGYVAGDTRLVQVAEAEQSLKCDEGSIEHTDSLSPSKIEGEPRCDDEGGEIDLHRYEEEDVEGSAGKTGMGEATDRRESSIYEECPLFRAPAQKLDRKSVYGLFSDISSNDEEHGKDSECETSYQSVDIVRGASADETTFADSSMDKGVSNADLGCSNLSQETSNIDMISSAAIDQSRYTRFTSGFDADIDGETNEDTSGHVDSSCIDNITYQTSALDLSVTGDSDKSERKSVGENEDENFVDVTGSEESEGEIHTSTPVVRGNKKIVLKRKPAWKAEIGNGLKLRVRLSSEWGVVENISEMLTNFQNGIKSDQSNQTILKTNESGTSTESFKLMEVRDLMAIEKTLNGEPSDYSWNEELSEQSVGRPDSSVDNVSHTFR